MVNGLLEEHQMDAFRVADIVEHLLILTTRLQVKVLFNYPISMSFMHPGTHLGGQYHLALIRVVPQSATSFFFQGFLQQFDVIFLHQSVSEHPCDLVDRSHPHPLGFRLVPQVHHPLDDPHAVIEVIIVEFPFLAQFNLKNVVNRYQYIRDGRHGLNQLLVINKKA